MTTDGGAPEFRTRTLCVHRADARGAHAGAPVVAPVVRSTVFHLDDAAYASRRAGRAYESYAYGRETNPTVENVEGRLAALEGAERALVFASGMAALHGVLMATLERGDNVVVAQQVYGGTLSLARALLPRLGVELRVVEFDDENEQRASVDARTRLFLCESISNPLSAVTDLPRIAALVAERSERGLLVVDATLASPVGQRPLALGAHVVLHSATKYLGGHSDLTGGVVAADAELAHLVWTWRTSAGGCMDPDGAALLDRGIKTLALRMRVHTENATRLTRFLAAHPRVVAVHYCGLEGDPSFDRGQRLLDETGGLFSFVVDGGDDAALRVIRSLRLAAEAASLGGVETFASRPVDLSHAYLEPDERARAGIVPGLVRISVGIEDIDDLVADFAQALDAGTESSSARAPR